MLKQITLGVLAGGLLIAAFIGSFVMQEHDFDPTAFHAVVFSGYLATMIGVCGSAAAGS